MKELDLVAVPESSKGWSGGLSKLKCNQHRVSGPPSQQSARKRRGGLERQSGGGEELWSGVVDKDGLVGA